MNEQQNFASFDIHDDCIVHIKFANFSPTDNQFRRFLIDLKSVLDQHHEFTLFVDTTDLPSTRLAYALQVAEFMRDNRLLFKEYCKASVLVINNDVVRTLLQTIFKIQKPVSPNKIVNNVCDGMEFLKHYKPITT